MVKKRLDRVFSLYIRNKYAREGYLKCYTCGVTKEIKSMHCGHFVSRSHLYTRFDEDNVRPQCVGCNIFGNGKTAVFATRLERENPGIVKELYARSQMIAKTFLTKKRSRNTKTN